MRPGSVCEPSISAKARDILDAARACFERYGFHAASMARIADEADISVGNIYRYFANKEAVVFAIVREDIEEISTDLERLNGSPEELADHALDTFKISRSRQKMILRLEVLAEGARNPKVMAMVSDMDRWIRDRIKIAISNAVSRQSPFGALEPSEMEVRLSLVGLLMEGLQLRTFYEGDNLQPGVTDQVRQLLIQAFSAAPISIDAGQPLAFKARSVA